LASKFISEAEGGNDQKADTHMAASRQILEAFIDEVDALKPEFIGESDAEEAIYFTETIIRAIDQSINWPGTWKG